MASTTSIRSSQSVHYSFEHKTTTNIQIEKSFDNPMNTISTTILALLLIAVNATDESPEGMQPVQLSKILAQVEAETRDAQTTKTMLEENYAELLRLVSRQRILTAEVVQEQKQAEEENRQLLRELVDVETRGQHQGLDTWKVAEKDAEIDILNSEINQLKDEFVRWKEKISHHDGLQAALDDFEDGKFRWKRGIEAEVQRLTEENEGLQYQLQMAQGNPEGDHDTSGSDGMTETRETSPSGNEQGFARMPWIFGGGYGAFESLQEQQ